MTRRTRSWGLVLGLGAFACGGVTDGGDGSLGAESTSGGAESTTGGAQGARTGGAGGGSTGGAPSSGGGARSASSGGEACNGPEDKARRLAVDEPGGCYLGCGGALAYTCDTIVVSLATPFDDPDLTLTIATDHNSSVGLIPDIGYPPASCPEEFKNPVDDGLDSCALEIRENGYLNGFKLSGVGALGRTPPTEISVNLVRKSNEEVLDTEIRTLTFSCEGAYHWCWDAAPIVMDLALPED